MIKIEICGRCTSRSDAEIRASLAFLCEMAYNAIVFTSERNLILQQVMYKMYVYIFKECKICLQFPKLYRKSPKAYYKQPIKPPKLAKATHKVTSSNGLSFFFRKITFNCHFPFVTLFGIHTVNVLIVNIFSHWFNCKQM